MSRFHAIFGLLIIALFLIPWAVAGSDTTLSTTHHQEMNKLLKNVSDQITSGLMTLEDNNQKSAAVLSDRNLSEGNISEALNAKLTAAPFAHSSLIIDPQGTVLGAAPAVYQNLIGINLNDSATGHANSVQKPVLSDIFLMKEGFYGVSLSYPIFSSSNEYKGYTDITFRPEEFLRQYIIPLIEQNNYDLFILEPEGMTVYETNEEEIGRNALTDPMYSDPALHEAAIAITGNRSGVITYPFWNRNWDRTIQREAVWDTLAFDGQEWRIAVVRDIMDNPADNTRSNGNQDSDTTDLNESIRSLTDFMENASAFVQQNGRKEALSSFNNLSGPWVSGERYIFAYDMNGTTLALPYQEGLIGKDRMNLTDANGLAILPGMLDLVKEGGGYLYYVYPNPADNFAPELKLYLIKPVDDTWFIGSGVYLPSIKSEISQQSLSELIQRVKQASTHADEVGKEQALIDFNDINGSYADGGSYIFAYGYDGTTLALPHQPELIGTDRLNYTDQYGCRIINMEINAAKRGGGFVYVVYYNPESGDSELKLCYVTPAGDDWLVGSGIYTGQNLTT